MQPVPTTQQHDSNLTQKTTQKPLKNHSKKTQHNTNNQKDTCTYDLFWSIHPVSWWMVQVHRNIDQTPMDE
jgi:hypothetical protein